MSQTHWVFENRCRRKRRMFIEWKRWYVLLLREIWTQEEALSVIHNIISVLGGIGIPEKKNNVFVAKNFSRNQNIVWMSPGIKNSWNWVLNVILFAYVYQSYIRTRKKFVILIIETSKTKSNLKVIWKSMLQDIR